MRRSESSAAQKENIKIESLLSIKNIIAVVRVQAITYAIPSCIGVAEPCIGVMPPCIGV